MSDERIIKRYQNRKLYDTHQSCYVTLEEIAQIIREGNEIKVIDNKTKDDITYMTQIQLLFDQERKSKEGGDVDLLKKVIRGPGGTFTGYIRSLGAESEAQVVDSEVEEVKSVGSQDIETLVASEGNGVSPSESPATSPLN